jgi:urease accessory protein
MTDLTVIRQALAHDQRALYHHHIRLGAPRATLAKRRWRGVAEDGREFGFDLDEALPHGSCFFADGAKQYVLEQAPEEVLEIVVSGPEKTARIAWNLGNLHFGVQITPEAIRVANDSAILQFLARENIAFKKVVCIFLPLSAASHHHHHDHG